MPEVSPFTSSVFILLSVVLIKTILSRFIIHQPLQFFRFFCDRLADKVNKPNNSSNQQVIAGIIAILVTLLPLVIILWLFENFIEVPQIWHALIIYFALGSFGISQKSEKIAQALISNNNYQAKQILSPLVLRDTDKLSNLGLSKACIEMQLLHKLQQGFIVGCYYLIAGPLAAITFRLLLEMHYSWNTKAKNFQFFGRYINQMINLLQWLPARLFVVILLLSTVGQNFILFWHLLKTQFFRLNNNMVVYSLALALEKQLGGVAMYNGSKLRRQSFNEQARQPEAIDIIHASKRVNQALYFAILVIGLIAVLSFAIAINY
ncbi:MAG: cobalamin biosynthesis protein [Colwellia sp.]|nr:cobalamin biosynthesis protein [Colwellia sp.]